MGEKEFDFKGFKANGFFMLFFNFILIAACVILFFLYDTFEVPGIILGVIGLITSFFIFGGFMQLEPNQARAMVFFGKYKGTFKQTGFFWVNPFSG
jgi:hypothetical protein